MNRKTWMVVAMAFLHAAALAAQAKPTPHLAGQWEGTAKRTLCGRDAGQVRVLWNIDDYGYRGVGSNMTVGDVSGELMVGNTIEGILAAEYDSGGKMKSNLSTHPAMMLSNARSPLANYWIEFSAGDAGYLGMGSYQSIHGSLSRDSAQCSQMGARGDVLDVTLRRK